MLCTISTQDIHRLTLPEFQDPSNYLPVSFKGAERSHTRSARASCSSSGGKRFSPTTVVSDQDPVNVVEEMSAVIWYHLNFWGREKPDSIWVFWGRFELACTFF